ncbi:MAG: response regulator [Myxococcota bacterium]
MLNDEAGKNCRIGRAARPGPRGEAGRGSACILVVDPVVGSRLAIAEAVSVPGVTVETASSERDARARMRRRAYALVLVEQDLGSMDGLDLLVELRSSHPETDRALVTTRLGVDATRGAIERAGLAFVVHKPWSPASLRATVREVLGGRPDFATWSRLPTRRPKSGPTEPSESPRDLGRQHEIIVRGLLAGFNSCEFESEVYELLHAELSESLGVERWLWLNEERDLAMRIAGDWPIEEALPSASLSERERMLLARARRSFRITRLEATGAGRDGLVCLGLAIRVAGRRAASGLVWLEARSASVFAAMLRELQAGLEMAFRRIREAQVRAEAARRLARRVSEELRTPVGALTHAIDRLRGEAERAGLPPEWVDRVSSESRRVVEAVEHLEGEMLSEAALDFGNAG